MGTNIIEHASEMELYIILPTFEMFLQWNQTFLIMKSADEMTQVHSPSQRLI